GGRTILIGVARIAIVAVRRVDANAVLEQTQRTGNGGVGSDDARQRDADRLEAAKVMTGIIEVEQFFGQLEKAATGFAQLHQRERIELQERDVLGQLKLAAILFEVRAFEAAQVILQFFSGEQPLFQTVPVAEIDIAAVLQAELKAERAFGAFCQIVRQLIALEERARNLPDLPLKELFIRVLAPHKLIGLFRVINLELLVVQFLLGDGLAQGRGGDRTIQLLDFFGGELLLKIPFLLAALIRRDGGGNGGVLVEERRSVVQRMGGEFDRLAGI